MSDRKAALGEATVCNRRFSSNRRSPQPKTQKNEWLTVTMTRKNPIEVDRVDYIVALPGEQDGHLD
jgi:hypothetical protein